MPSFSVAYRTPDSPNVVKDVVSGRSETLVRQELMRRGWSVLLVRERKPTFAEWMKAHSTVALKLPRFGVSTAELALLCEIFKALYSSGVQMLQIVEMTIDETPNPWLRKRLAIVLEHLRIGDSLADAMSDPRCRKAFPPLMVETIRTGEANGRLDDALDRLKRTFKRMADTKRETTSAMMYPLFTVLVFFGVCTVLAIMIPNALEDFLGPSQIQQLRDRLPMSIRILFAVRENPEYLAFPPLLVGSIVVAWIYGMKFRTTRYSLTVFRRRFPLIGKLLEQFALIRFLEVLTANHESGIAIGDSLQLVHDSVDEAVFEESLSRIRDNIMRNGVGLGDAIEEPSELSVYPGLVRQMVKAGEVSGRFTEMLQPMISFYEEQSKAQLKRMLDMITPTMIIVLGAVVGPVVLGVYQTIVMMTDAAYG